MGRGKKEKEVRWGWGRGGRVISGDEGKLVEV
jgi:hypothetical protein